jgi:hypothetical protein
MTEFKTGAEGFPLEWCRFEVAEAFDTPIIEENPRVLHKGGCHCGAVRFEITAPEQLVVWDCNCSICLKKKNPHVVVPQADFKLVKGEEALTTYTFGTGVAKHVRR